jgi:hypothetical protein
MAPLLTKNVEVVSITENYKHSPKEIALRTAPLLYCRAGAKSEGNNRQGPLVSAIQLESQFHW